VSLYDIHDVASLREIIGNAMPGLAAKNQPRLNSTAVDFLARCPFVVLSTADAQGRVDASPKGDAPGFILVEDNRTIVIPDRPGNKLVYGLENILANPQVGLLCMIPNTQETLRINGRAELTADPALLEQLAARGKNAIIGIRVHIDECFFHCAKAFIRSGLWEPDSWGAKDRISFGKLFAELRGADEATATAIDQSIEENYRTGL
jgi:uncharacterized protein